MTEDVRALRDIVLEVQADSKANLGSDPTPADRLKRMLSHEDSELIGRELMELGLRAMRNESSDLHTLRMKAVETVTWLPAIAALLLDMNERLNQIEVRTRGD